MPHKNPHYYRDYFRAQGEKRRAYLRRRYAQNPSSQALATQKYRASAKGKATRHAYNKSLRARTARTLWRSQHRDRATASAFRWRLKKRGVDMDWFQRQLELQGFSCSICRAPFPADGLRHVQIDHDHVTSRVRGLLCMSCNNGLGCFRDTIDYLIAAAAYLKQSLGS